MINLKKISEEQLEAIKILGEYQMGKSVYINCDISPLIGFEHEESGVLIVNPFLDDMGWGTVNPIKYYGDEFLNSDYLKIDISDINKYKETEIIAFCDGEEEFVGSSYELLDIYEYVDVLEDTVLEAVKNGVAEKQFTNGKWTIYTKEAYENRNK